jgi:hypothetical protein
MDEISLFDAIYSARALRRFKPDPVVPISIWIRRLEGV